jgi:ferredoxin
MIRKIIHIDEEKCNGCGICATACHEGAIDMVDGKAKLVREHFCDGFGDCLPGCPTGAITFEEREAPEYDHQAVLEAQAKKAACSSPAGCPGARTECGTGARTLSLPSASAAKLAGADQTGSHPGSLF